MSLRCWFGVCDQVSGGIVKSKRSKHEEAGSSKNLIEKCDDKYTNKDDTKPPEPPKDYIHVRARRGQPADSHRLAERVLLPSENRFVFLLCVHFSVQLWNVDVCVWLSGKKRKDQRDANFTSGSGSWFQPDNRESSFTWWNHKLCAVLRETSWGIITFCMKYCFKTGFKFFLRSETFVLFFFSYCTWSWLQ